MTEERRSPNPGNFAEDRERASRAGRVGGQHSSGNFANDRERAAEAGRKGGQAKPWPRVPFHGRRGQRKATSRRIVTGLLPPGPGWPKSN